MQSHKKHHRSPTPPLPLQDLENTVGSWDMYGQDAKARYNGLQSEFFERAAGGLTRREYLLAVVGLGEWAEMEWLCPSIW